MRDYVLFYVNSKRYAVGGDAAFASLSDFLRYELQLTGTKVVCAEGDCGACTVLVSRRTVHGLRYETVDACLLFLYQLDGSHVITVEGLPAAGSLHPVQQALVDHHASQCGYCTPGFVMSLAGLFEQHQDVTEDSLRTRLTGNLCRCTGYLPILEAARSVASNACGALAQRYASGTMATDLCANTATPVCIRSRRTFFAPRRLEQALEFKAEHPDAVIVAGGTELGVLRNKKGIDPPTLLALTHVPGLNEIRCTDETVEVGANVTLSQLEEFSRGALPELYLVILRFGSPQIRNVSTLVGNVANGSPIADALPFLLVMDAELELLRRGGSRHVKINNFYRGYKIKDLAPEEIIARVFIPLPAADELLRLYKVSRRNDLDIATFAAAIRVRRAGEVITRAYLAYAGVAPTVVRLPATEAFLQGKLFTEATFREAGRLARSEIQPISDVRGSRDFRLLLAENILMKYHGEAMIFSS
jgi:xanthine dehydrogenase small subunit